MFLFSRRTQLVTSRTREAVAWATDLTDRINRTIELPLSLFQQVFSSNVGTMSWSTFAPDFAALEAANDKLMSDEGYLAALEASAGLTNGIAHDTLAEVCRPGGLSRGIAVGVEIAQRAERITGTPTMFLVDTTGAYGGVGWITGHHDAAAMQAANAALNADAGWLDYLDQATPGAFSDNPFATEQTIFRRMM
jgi:hypothetical protein